MRVPAERALARESAGPRAHPLGRAASLPVARDTGTWLVPSEAHCKTISAIHAHNEPEVMRSP